MMARLFLCVIVIWQLSATCCRAADELPLDSQAAGHDHWAYLPIERPVPPPVDDQRWAHSAIDRFVYDKLKKLGLDPVDAADKRTLLRRATLGLIGLPPTTDEIDAFLADSSPDAFVRVVDRLLASPQYGVRWGRHWLDVARYADTNGLDENKPFPNAFRYRDYVIDAFNRDKPYNEFVSEQLAGDLLVDDGDGDRLAERITATGFLVIGAKVLAEPDATKMNLDIVDEQVDVIGKVFMAQTLGCARCHDHKFDPISMEDYYGLAGILKSTEAMIHYINVAEWRERELASEEALQRRRAHLEALESARDQLGKISMLARAPWLNRWRRQLGEYLVVATKLADLIRPREAEDFSESNLRVKRGGDEGGRIGVVYQIAAEEAPFVEWHVELPEAGPYRFDLRYTSIYELPLTLTINGNIVAYGVASSRIDDEIAFAHFQRWEEIGIYQFRQGNNVIRLAGERSFPYVDQFVLVPQSDAAAYVRQRAKLIESQRLEGAVVDNWIRFLQETKRSEDPIFAVWHALAPQLSEQGNGPTRPLVDQVLHDATNGRLRVTPPALAVLRGNPPESLQELAERYQQLFAAVAWWDMAETALVGNDHIQSALADRISVLSQLREPEWREVLFSDDGPFAFPASAERLLDPSMRRTMAALRRRVAKLVETLPPDFPRAMAVAEGQIADLPVHLRGDPLQLAATPVRRRSPGVLGGGAPPMMTSSDESGRRELAEWLVHPEHPLTGRVMANRIWYWHFGTGIVDSPSNFGLRGSRPTHPELLDWLARSLVEHDWSIKRVHKQILSSQTYQLGNRAYRRAMALDPESRYYWRANARRLEAEAIRDAMFTVGDNLDLQLGGGFEAMSGGEYVRDMSPEYRWPRRAAYLPIVRINMNPMMAAFDYADPTMSLEQRQRTVVAPQALFLLNSPLVRQQARRFAESLLRPPGGERQRIKTAYLKAYGRPPSQEELRDATAFLASMRRHYSEREAGGAADPDATASRSDAAKFYAWTKFCHTVIASSEFIYVN